jgi:hypothetical protein
MGQLVLPVHKVLPVPMVRLVLLVRRGCRVIVARWVPRVSLALPALTG